MNGEIIFLTLEQILAMHEDFIDTFGGSHGVRDLNLLESAIYRPQVTFGGNELYQSVYDKAAVLIHSLLLNHPFIDGNKRTGIASGLQFLSENDIKISTSQEELIELALSIESKKI